jgi:ribonucleoside-diphosphate reductase alpha chain
VWLAKIHKEDITAALETYNLMSERWFTFHATPTLFNAGTPKPQMSSCFFYCKCRMTALMLQHRKQCAKNFSKCRWHRYQHSLNIRATGSYIKGTNGSSNGIIPMLKVFNETARYVDQGEGKTQRFCAVCQNHGMPIFIFLDIRKMR